MTSRSESSASSSGRLDAAAEIFTPSRPLGPIAAEENLDRDRLSLLFDGHNKIAVKLNHDRSLILGRKGSGKTTLLTSVLVSDERATTYYLPSSDFFSLIVNEIESLSSDVAFVEQISQLWDFALWGIVFNDLCKKDPKSPLLRYCTALNISGALEPYVVIDNMLKAIKEFPPADWPLAAKVIYKEIGGISFLQAKKIAGDQLKKDQRKIFLLIDSLEDYKLDVENNGHAISGLLKCLGEFNSGAKTNVTLRCCVPAEKYHQLVAISTNPMKDFRDGILLHWSAGELIQMCAKRYSKYIEINEPEFYAARVRNLKFDTRVDVEKFWNAILPPDAGAGLGGERPIAYILRHTQLLPRHFLLYMNDIIGEAIKSEGAFSRINGTGVRRGVFNQCGLIHDQILQAYSQSGRDLASMCRAILPELPSVFGWSELDSVFARLPKNVGGFDVRSGILEALSEIGAVGRLVGESERYYHGVFEYMVPHRLTFSSKDQFCIHPIFSHVYNPSSTEKPRHKPVYTYWSGITDSELEHWM